MYDYGVLFAFAFPNRGKGDGFLDIIEFLKAVLLGIIQGITEWLPISSTGHMILFDSFWPMDKTRFTGGQAFVDLFLVVIQFGSILAVLVLYFHKLNPFSPSKNQIEKRQTFSLWGKVIIATIPAMILGLLFDDMINDYLYNAVTVAIMLIVYGIFFLLAENRHRRPRIQAYNQLDMKTLLLIGLFQALAMIPGTSRSGATILGAVLLGCSRSVAAEFSFFLAIPTMLGASALKIFKYFKDYGIGFTSNELIILLTGMIVAFLVSVLVIRLFMGFIRKHDFKPFGWYRIALGALILILFFCNILQIVPA